MGIKVAINHRTSYKYKTSIKVWPQVIKLRPAPHCRTSILSYSMQIEPSNHFINWMQDPFGNYQARIVFPEKVDKFEVNVDVIAELTTINPFDFFLEESAETFPFEYDEQQAQDLLPYLKCEPTDDRFIQLLNDCKQYEGQNTVDFLVAINQHIYNLLDYEIRLEPGVQSCHTTLERKLGSCRDFAWLLVQLLRHMGMASRFVSGYLVQLKSDEVIVDGPIGPEADFTDLHAWTEVYIPGAGWIGLDSTSGLFAGEGHIPLACTPDAQSAAPIIGSVELTETEFDFSNTVQRILDKPKITKPYRLDQWNRIKSLGHEVDERLDKQDVKLTMGGEPTFISMTDMESDQWNTTPDGPEKRKLAYDLSLELKARFGSTGLIHTGQGKWYPGEPIPRWQNAIYWRRDGSAIINNDVLANPNEKGNLSWEDLISFSQRLCSNLGIPREYLTLAYEDKYYYLWEQANLPVDQQQKSKSEQKLARVKLDKLLLHGIDEPVGQILPIQFDLVAGSWESSKWSLSREKLFLIPGNSQLGYRLPLDRLNSSGENIEAIKIPNNHFIDTPTLTDVNIIDNVIDARKASAKSKDQLKVSIGEPIISTLCFEIKEGRLHVFLPPLDDANQFLDLIRCIELAAVSSEVQIVIEGYQAPYHSDLIKLEVTPDPGVIEVNIHPAQNWAELLHIYDELFEATNLCKLGTNKFMIDGKHTGTGGGNHITLGGATPADSPFLRNPRLLRSMISFWHNHPSLSYLFASPFIGTTSQSPRLDEGRPNIIYELEIAFRELDKYDNPPFYLVDRILRNFLTDITGNTHRAEFCIDKLYNPDSMSGRLGILELRAFDMPPHHEMCIVQLLLIRSLVAIFWEHPYVEKLHDWGSDLHNRFMIHHYVKDDIYDVIRFINSHGIAFEADWMDIFLDFRFPEIGHLDINGMLLSLRSGLEPWRVLGEEISSNGTARFVDSSMERVEVIIEGIDPNKYKVLCNQVEVPLIYTGYPGRYVAGIKYKAWAPSSALHPTIPIDAPLIFDIYDNQNERSIAGCTYHIVHPGGRSYDTYPINSLEAESRRATRFWDFNHSTPTQVVNTRSTESVPSSYISIHQEPRAISEIIKIPISKDIPHTLDLRRK